MSVSIMPTAAETEFGLSVSIPASSNLESDDSDKLAEDVIRIESATTILA
jgi:hypothetical protein